MADFTLRPHTFQVFRNTGADDVPPTSNKTLMLSGACIVQTAPSGGITNDNEAMQYDYVLFHDEPMVELLQAEDEVQAIVGNTRIFGNVKKFFEGQLSNRIWFDEVVGNNEAVITSYNLTLSSSVGGSVLPYEGMQSHSLGESIPIYAKADSGYQFLEFVSDEISIFDELISVNMNADKEYKANFIPI